MLNSKGLRAKAWESLKGGKFWMALLACLITGFLYSIGSSFSGLSGQLAEIPAMVDPSDITGVLEVGAVAILGASSLAFSVGFIFTIFVGNPALIGCCGYFIKNTDSKPALSEVFSGFKTKYGRNIGIMLLIDIKIALWTCLFIVPGIIKAFEYAIIPYILADDSDISSKDAFKKAKEVMKGNKWRLFKLNFSFIGWFILATAVGSVVMLLNSVIGIIAAVLAGLFLTPYIDAANAEFYVELKNK